MRKYEVWAMCYRPDGTPTYDSPANEEFYRFKKAVEVAAERNLFSKGLETIRSFGTWQEYVVYYVRYETKQGTTVRHVDIRDRNLPDVVRSAIIERCA